MKLRILVVIAVLVAVALVPSTAWAKGAKKVIITGRGLDGPVHIDNAHLDNAEDSASLSRLVQATGLYHAAFHTTPSPMTNIRPAGRLGPRYRAVFELYASEDTVTLVRQDLYPFAKAGFVTYTSPEQRVMQSTAPGGWYVASTSSSGGEMDGRSATAMLVALGAHDRGTMGGRAGPK